jgi:starch-binding outer membrane protein, SusD/RagB family
MQPMVSAGIEKVKNDVDLWPKIEADMDFAYKNLPEKQDQVGRVNKWAAAAYLAKVYMYQNKFAAAKALYDVIIARGVTSNEKKYALVAKFPDVFKASNDNNEESVWAYQAAANTGTVNNANPEFDLNWPYNTGADGPGNCCSFFQPTFDMANSFRTAGGLPIITQSTAGVYDYNVGTNQLKTDMGIESTASFIPDAGPLDPRIDHTIGRRGIPYLDWQDFPGKSWIRNQPNAGPYQTKKYVYYKADKGGLQDNSSWTPGYTAINYTIIRFADVLLMAAEAEIEAGDPMKARTYVNMVRERAKNSPLLRGDGSPAANYNIELYADAWGKNDATREKVRFERKLELSGEGHRFYDLIRWSSITPHYAMNVLNSYFTYEAPKLPLGALNGARFRESRDEYLPIPQAQIDLLGAEILKQNSGY